MVVKYVALTPQNLKLQLLRTMESILRLWIMQKIFTTNREEFDVIFLRDVFHFIASPFVTLEKYFNILKDGGVFMTTSGSVFENKLITSTHHATIPNHPTLSAL